MTTDRDLESRLRLTLEAVSETVDTAPAPRAGRSPRPHRRRIAIGVGVAIAAVPLVAAATIGFGPEHVDELPPGHPIVTGSLDGERYWVVGSFHTDACDRPMPGVELVVEEDNILGREWSTHGFSHGDDGRCGTAAVPDDPSSTYVTDGGASVGDGMVWIGALHPDVDQVQATLDGGDAFDVGTLSHEGDRYVVLEVPPGTSVFTVDYLVDGQVVTPPASDAREHVVP